VPAKASQLAAMVSSTTSCFTEDKKPAVEDVIPPETLRGLLTMPSAAPTVAVKIPSSTLAQLPMAPGMADHHRSWVLSVPTVALAIHFSID
jgi:hypothetical protein